MKPYPRTALLSTLSVLMMAPVFPVGAARELSFEERVRAQEAVERVYYSHQIGALRPFDQAVPRQVVESRVRVYLEESVALERFWHTSITAVMLRAESNRMARQTRLPERLQELYAAVGNDTFVFQETVARAALVDRLLRSFFAHDSAIHAAARREAESLRQRVLTGEFHPLEGHPRRTVAEAVMQQSGEALEDPAEALGAAPSSRERPQKMSPERFREWRESLPRSAGEVGPLRDGPTGFSFSIVLAEDDQSFRVATYTVAKTSFEDWFLSVQARLGAGEVRAVAASDGSLPKMSRDPMSRWPVDLGSIPSSDFEPATLNSACVEDTWDNGSLASVPDGREGVTAVWTGSHMIVWGGTNFTDAKQYNTGGRYDPATDTWTGTSIVNAPSPRYRHTATWTGSVMVVWGGTGPTGVFLATGGRYDPVADTWLPTSPTNAPSPRFSHAAVWTGNAVVVWGGFGLTSPSSAAELNTGGIYDPAADSWSPTSTLGAPETRQGHSAVWTGTEMLVWGGGMTVPTHQYWNTGGSYDPGSDRWTSMTTAKAPSARWQHSAVWSGTSMLVWGGYGSGSAGEGMSGGRYDPQHDSWKAMTSVNAPSGVVKHAAAWTGNRLVIWGGTPLNLASVATGGRYDPVTDTWSPTSLTNAPARREGHAAAWTGSQVIVWGGRTDEASQNSGGRYDPVADTWTPTSLGSAPAARNGSRAVWTGSKMIVWGGIAPGPSAGTTLPLNSGGLYDPALDQWTPTSLANAPTARQDHTAVWVGDRMIIWGGLGSTFLNTGGLYDPLTDAWNPTSLTDSPGARDRHTAVWTGHYMIVWGGIAAGASNTGARYDPRLDRWTPTTLSGAPAGRMDHVAVWTGRTMFVWGGRPYSAGVSGSGALYDPEADRWTMPTALAGAPTGREGATAVWTGRYVIVWGGFSNPSYLNTGGLYDPSMNQWTATSLTGAPQERWAHSAAWTGSRMIVWGGLASGPTYYDSGGRFDPDANAWDPTSDIGAPTPRSAHAGLWTSSQMLVWSGADRFTYLNSGGRYCACNGGTTTYYQDADGDGFGDASVSVPACGVPPGFVQTGTDCSDLNSGAWSPPSEVAALDLGGSSALNWTQPVAPGAATVLYDLIRSPNPAQFQGQGVCVASDIPDSNATDPADPAVGRAFFYLVRPENSCPGGQGPLGFGSDGALIVGPACP